MIKMCEYFVAAVVWSVVAIVDKWTMFRLVALALVGVEVYALFNQWGILQARSEGLHNQEDKWSDTE